MERERREISGSVEKSERDLSEMNWRGDRGKRKGSMWKMRDFREEMSSCTHQNLDGNPKLFREREIVNLRVI
jgi:hypothetical protein